MILILDAKLYFLGLLLTINTKFDSATIFKLFLRSATYGMQ